MSTETTTDTKPQVGQYTESDDERASRLPAVLEGYAKDIDKYGKPVDSGLAPVLRFAASRILTANTALERANTPFEDADERIQVFKQETWYCYRLVNNGETGPFQTWREAYRSAESHLFQIELHHANTALREAEGKVACKNDCIVHLVQLLWEYANMLLMQTGQTNVQLLRLPKGPSVPGVQIRGEEKEAGKTRGQEEDIGIGKSSQAEGPGEVSREYEKAQEEAPEQGQGILSKQTGPIPLSVPIHPSQCSSVGENKETEEVPGVRMGGMPPCTSQGLLEAIGGGVAMQYLPRETAQKIVDALSATIGVGWRSPEEVEELEDSVNSMRQSYDLQKRMSDAAEIHLSHYIAKNAELSREVERLSQHNERLASIEEWGKKQSRLQIERDSALAKCEAMRGALETMLAAMETCRDHCYSDGMVHHQSYNTDLVGNAILKGRHTLASTPPPLRLTPTLPDEQD